MYYPPRRQLNMVATGHTICHDRRPPAVDVRGGEDRGEHDRDPASGKPRGRMSTMAHGYHGTGNHTIRRREGSTMAYRRGRETGVNHSDVVAPARSASQALSGWDVGWCKM